jgi:large subunit ribosomal protein L21
MYAVIESGGKQFRVELGSEIDVERVEGQPGETVELGRVLLVADGDVAEIGRPVVDRARVSASVVRHDRGDKVVVFKYRPKARHRAKHGHRQGVTRLRVSDIVLGNRSAAKEAEAARTEQDRYREAVESEAARQASADRELARRLARQAEAEKPEAEAEPTGARGRGRGRSAGGTRPTAAETPSTSRRRAAGVTQKKTREGAKESTAGRRTQASAPRETGTRGRATTKARSTGSRTSSPRATGKRSGTTSSGSDKPRRGSR